MPATIRYVAYPRGPRFDRKEAVWKLSLLCEGYRTIRWGRGFLITQAITFLASYSDPLNLYWIAIQIALGVICFLLTLGSLGRIGSALHWRWSTYFLQALLFASIPTFARLVTASALDYLFAVFGVALACQATLELILRKEALQYGIRFRGYHVDAVVAHIRAEIAKLEAEPLMLDTLPLSVADRAEIG